MARASDERLTRPQLVIIDLLRSGGEMTGLELLEEAEGQLERALVYVDLNRLELRDLVRSRFEPSAQRRRYRLTGAGYRALGNVGRAEPQRAGGAFA